MAQLLRRTKKCCAKFLRKLSLTADSPSSSSDNIRKPNSTSSASQRNRSRIAPSPQHTGKFAFGRYVDDGTPDELSINGDVYDDMGISNNNNNNNILRLKNNNITKCFRIQRNHQLSLSNDSNNTTEDKDKSIANGEIIFTENRIYIGLTERNINRCGTATNRGKVKKQIFNASSEQQTETDNLNLASNLKENHRKCSRKLNFEVQRCTGSDDSSLTTSSSSSSSKRDADRQVVFEKVKYDRNKRYLQSSPSNSSTNTCNSLEQYLNHSTNEMNSIKSKGGMPTSHQSSAMIGWTTTNHLPIDLLNNNGLSTNPWDENASITSETIIECNDTPDPWYFLDHFHNRKKSHLIDSKCTFSKYQTIHYENVSSSRRTSVSTTETWIDDESFDNSFNEELEKRCAALAR